MWFSTSIQRGKFSREMEGIIAAVLYLSGALITTLAPGLPVLIVGRMLFGLGIGLAMHAAPL